MHYNVLECFYYITVTNKRYCDVNLLNQKVFFWLKQVRKTQFPSVSISLKVILIFKVLI